MSSCNICHDRPGLPLYCNDCLTRQDNTPQEFRVDLINNPAHYTTGGIETIDFIQAKLTPEQFKGHLMANILKYVTRHRHKNGVEDLKKARWYLDKLIEVSGK